MDQIERIEKMEGILNRYREKLDGANRVLAELEEAQTEYQQLREYYGSEEFFKDTEDADTGRLPGNVPCGVLSGDAVSDLITDQFNLAVRMLELSSQILQKH